MIHILMTCYNREPYLEKSIGSLLLQTVSDWQCWIMDDVSTDNSVRIALDLTEMDSRFHLILNTQKKYGQAGNYAQVVYSNPDIHDEDILVCLDGDDWFPDAQVLTRVLQAYSDQKTWITWGSYALEYYPERLINGRRISSPLARGHAAPTDVDNIRRVSWVVSHLRTFKAFLFRSINDGDLRDPETGWYFLAGADVPFIFPMCEMAGPEHSKYLPEINYIYNHNNPICEFKTHYQEQHRTEALLRSWPKYSRLIK